MACRIRASLLCFAFGTALLAASIAGAAPLSTAPTLQFKLESTSSSYPYYANPELIPSDAGPTYTAVGFGSFGTLGMSWDVVVDPDPLISGTLIITNLSALTDTFTLTGTLPATPLPGPNVMGGYFGAITYTDSNSNSTVTLSTVGTNPFYQAMIDGLPVQGLGSFSLNAFGGPGVFGTASQQSFGAPIPNAPAPAVGSSIGVALQFSLTAGDSVEIPFLFEVASVPEPSTVLLIGVALAGIAAQRRSRR